MTPGRFGAFSAFGFHMSFHCWVRVGIRNCGRMVAHPPALSRLFGVLEPSSPLDRTKVWDNSQNAGRNGGQKLSAFLGETFQFTCRPSARKNWMEATSELETRRIS